ncbi:conjugative transfer relaxase/helicase TraI domain-containing protein [Yersinia enterocolitica]
MPNREGWLNTLNKQANQHTAHDLLHHADDKAAQVAERLLATATPLQDTALGRKLLDTSGLEGKSMAHFIAPGKKYPSPHIALPVWDSNGNRAGVYLDEVRFQKEGRGVWLSHEPRVMGSEDARFAGLQVSRNGETHVAATIQTGLQLAHDNPDSGVLIRLSGEGLPSNINRITGSLIVPEEDTARQAQAPAEEPLPFIPDEAAKRAAELDKQAREIVHPSPEKEKQQQLIEKVAELRASTPEDILKSFNTESLRKEDLSLDRAIEDVARAEMPHERLQQLERDIVKQKTFGE